MQLVYMESQLCTGSWIILVHPMAACLGSAQRDQMCLPCKELFLSLQDAWTLYMTQTCFLVLIYMSLLSFHPVTKVHVSLLGLGTMHDPALWPKSLHLRHKDCHTLSQKECAPGLS